MNAQEIIAILVLGLALLLVGSIIVISVVHEKKRRLSLQRWAQSHGWTYSRENDETLAQQCANFRCLHKKGRRQCYNRIVGASGGRPFLAFDHLIMGNGKKKRVRRSSVVIMPSQIPLKPLLIRPRNFLYDIAQMLGARDIVFPSKDFNRKFVVRAEDDQWAQEAIHEEVVQVLLNAPPCSIEFNQSTVLICKSGSSTPAEIESALKLAEAIIDLLPESLRRDPQSQDHLTT